jgi:hypothetical protein
VGLDWAIKWSRQPDWESDTDGLLIARVLAQPLVSAVCLAALLFPMVSKFTLSPVRSLAVRPILRYDP